MLCYNCQILSLLAEGDLIESLVNPLKDVLKGLSHGQRLTHFWSCVPDSQKGTTQHSLQR